MSQAIITTTDRVTAHAVESLRAVINKQTNVKQIDVQHDLPDVTVTVKVDYGKLGPAFGQNTPKVIAKLNQESPETVLKHIQKDGKFPLTIDGNTFNVVKEHLIINRKVPEPYVEAIFSTGQVYVNKKIDHELEMEGFARELMRRVQALRKKAGLQKQDSITLFVKTDTEMQKSLQKFNDQIQEKVGAKHITISEKDPANQHSHTSIEKVKDREFSLYLDKV